MHATAAEVRDAWQRAWGHAYARPAAMVGFTLLTAAAAFVRFPLPGTPVPFTMQLLPVLLAGAVLGRGFGAGSQVLYLGLGAAGVPWFAGAGAGLGVFAFATAGYLAGFPLAAWLVGWLGQGQGARRLFAAMMLGVLAVHALGALHLSMVLQLPIEAGILLGVLPFVAADAGKAAVASSLAARLRGG